MTQHADQLAQWYSKSARTFLGDHAPDSVSNLDADFQRLAQLRKDREQELVVCFLGASGVGKSTLLNALVGGHISVLPAGGIGPLTAQATVVRYAESSFLRVTYLGPGQLSKVLFALERFHELELKRAGARVDEARDVADLASSLDEDERLDAELSIPDEQEADGSQEFAGASEKIEAYRKRACLMIGGNQFASTDLPYLLDGLRLCLGREQRWGAALKPEDAGRIERIREVLALAKDKEGGDAEYAMGDDLPRFLLVLQDHASGFLAPLIKTLEVGWNSDFLKGGLLLVDLPGLGVANDEYRRVTAKWIRKARAVVLVVDRAGVTEPSADLLRSTGFLTGLLHDSHDPEAEPVTLMVSVVKLDLVADEERKREKLILLKQARNWVAHFEDACEKSQVLIHGQMETELGRISSAGGETTRVEREAALRGVIDGMQVHTIAATEFRKLEEDDEDEPPCRLKTAEQTRVPQFRQALQGLVRQREARAEKFRTAIAATLCERSRGTLDVIYAQWQTEQRAEEEADRLRQELEDYVKPLRDEFNIRQGAFREFLRGRIPELIDNKVDLAAADAEREINRLLTRTYSKYHWATMRAAVRRGGTFVGARHVDLPNDLTLLFEEPVAVVWSKSVLAELRKRTSELGADYVEMVGSIVEWSRGQGGRVQEKLITALHQDLKAETKGLATIGREAIDELKSNVKEELYEKLEKQVRKKCEQFVSSNKDVGTGVKQRIQDMLTDELAADVVKVARPAAKRVLHRNYAQVSEEITAALGKYRNPIDTAVDAIVGSHEQYLKRSDAQKRRRVIEQCEALLTALPQDCASQGSA